MIITRAPLRIPLGGGGTDFPSYYLKYGGFILGFSLNKYVYVVLHDTINGKIRLKYSKNEVVDNLDQLENRVAAEALKQYGISGGIEIATFSDVPESSGLGGSSSFCVALVTALRKKLGMSLDKLEISASAYDIERVKAGQPGGIQDQFFAALGDAWCLKLDEEFVNSKLDVSGLLPKLRLVYTNTGRTDLGIASVQTKKTVDFDRAMVDNLDTIKSLGYSIQEEILKENYDEVGKLFHRHWELKKKRDGSISNSEVDKLYGLAKSKGALGGKLLGLGGGGYLLLYTNNELNGLDCMPVGIDTEGVKVLYEG